MKVRCMIWMFTATDRWYDMLNLESSQTFDYQSSIEPVAVDTVLTLQGKIIRKEVQEAKKWQK